MSFHKHKFNLPTHQFSQTVPNEADAYVIPLLLGVNHFHEDHIFYDAIQAFKKRDLLPKPGKHLIHFDISSGKHIAIVNLDEDSTTLMEWSEILESVVPSLAKQEGVSSVVIYDIPFGARKGDYTYQFRHLPAKVGFACATPWTAKKKDEEKKSGLVIHWHVEEFRGCESSDVEAMMKGGVSAAWARSWAKMLVELPSNYLTPSTFADEVEKQVASINNPDLTVKVLGRKEMEKLEMGSLLAVAKGSQEKPKLVVVEYNGGRKSEKPVVLVGKGLTFDSGGISIKPSNGMADMKGDMAGAASALAAVLYAAKAGLKLNVVAIAACVENMPDGGAVKPGDVVTASNGTTIEVIDTDAEGRLVLADALVYSQQFEGRYTIDLATLTGACIVALGHIHTGVFTKNDELAAALVKAGDETADLAWRLPLVDAHEEMLESKVADISNLCLGKGAGAQNGAVFLQKFAPENWAHMDIAGSASNKGGDATGRPVDLLTTFLDGQAEW